MNAFAGGWLSPIVTAYLATHFGWKQALDFAALLTAIGGLLWIFVDASENLDESPTQGTAPHKVA
jgi:ACS family glucarate transporter-like MFS transporter